MTVFLLWIAASFLNFHWWLVAFVCAFILWKASPSSRFWWSFIITYGLAFLYETYIAKDVFPWLPYLAVIAVMCIIPNWIVWAIRKETPSEATQSESAKEDEVVLDEWNKDLYGVVWKELEQGKQDTTLWAKLYAAHSGDEQKVKAEYIKSRVMEMAGSRNRLIELGEQTRQEYEEKQKNVFIEFLKRRWSTIFLLISVILFLVVINRD